MRSLTTLLSLVLCTLVGCDFSTTAIDQVRLEIEPGASVFYENGLKITLTNGSDTLIGVSCQPLWIQQKDDGTWSSLARLYNPLVYCNSGAWPLASGDKAELDQRMLNFGTYRIGAEFLINKKKSVVFAPEFTIAE